MKWFSVNSLKQLIRVIQGDMSHLIVPTFEEVYENLQNLDDEKADKTEVPKVYYDATSGWNSQIDLVSEEGAFYVYTDYRTDEDGNLVAGVKVGDGNAYVVDLPFLAGNDEVLSSHINDTSIHITDEERTFWNNKVTAFLSASNNENLVLTKE